MKKLMGLILTVILLLALSACGNSSGKSEEGSVQKGDVKSPMASSTDDIISSMPEGVISREQALTVALSHAGISESEARDIDIDFDRERGGYEWEVDFDNGGFEYSYDIDAKTGEIIHSEKEIDD